MNDGRLLKPRTVQMNIVLFQLSGASFLRVFLSTVMPGVCNTRGERDRIALRGQNVGFYLAGKRTSEICEITGLHRSTVHRWLKK